MLRYFYILLCIQLCFSSDYIIDHIDKLDGRFVRSKNIRLHKKYTRSPKRSRGVQFDVDNFMRPSNEPVYEYDPYSNRNARQIKRRASEKYGDQDLDIVPRENFKTKSKIGKYVNIDEPNPVKARAPVKQEQGRQFNLQSLSLEDKRDGKIAQSHEKPGSNNYRKLTAQELGHPEAKCSFKNMRIPFFSYSKSATSAKPISAKKKRRMFCFNCLRKSDSRDNGSKKSDDKDQTNNKSMGKKYRKINKRDYVDLCPKCVQGLFGRGSKNKEPETTTNAVLPKLSKGKELGPVIPGVRKQISVDKNKSSDTHSLLDDYHNYLPYKREKRSEEIEQEDKERDRRLKELEEVEQKIENVHVTAGKFTRFPLKIKN